jgi:hypothetical protein
MPRRTVLRTATLAGLAVAGIVLGHAITYAGLSPTAVAREAWLTATGHGYLPVAGRLGLVAALAVLAGAFLRGLDGEGWQGWRSLERRLVPLMVGGFVVIEITERIAAGAGFGDLVRVVPLGVPVQIGIGFVLAAAIRWSTRTGAAIAATVRGRALRPKAPFVLALVGVPPEAGRPFLAAVASRGPPPAS